MRQVLPMLNVLEVHSNVMMKKDVYLIPRFFLFHVLLVKVIPVVLCVVFENKTDSKNCCNYLCELSRSHCVFYEDYCLLGCDVMRSVTCLLSFRRNILP
jgi:hypothetical protein